MISVEKSFKKASMFNNRRMIRIVNLKKSKISEQWWMLTEPIVSIVSYGTSSKVTTATTTMTTTTTKLTWIFDGW